MGKSNKSAREELERIYGKQCFIEKLHLRPETDKREYKGKAQYKRMKQLTYHHIREKSRGGKATVENGAILSAENHMWFNQQSKEKQEEMNRAFQDFKASFGINCASFVVNENKLEAKRLKPDKEIEIELPPEIESGVIELEFNSPEEQAQYEEYKKQKIEQKYKKFGVETPEQKWKREQKEIMEDVLDELRY